MTYLDELEDKERRVHERETREQQLETAIKAWWQQRQDVIAAISATLPKKVSFNARLTNWNSCLPEDTTNWNGHLVKAFAGRSSTMLSVDVDDLRKLAEELGIEVTIGERR
jgi:hypothetical protein